MLGTPSRSQSYYVPQHRQESARQESARRHLQTNVEDPAMELPLDDDRYGSNIESILTSILSSQKELQKTQKDMLKSQNDTQKSVEQLLTRVETLENADKKTASPSEEKKPDKLSPELSVSLKSIIYQLWFTNLITCRVQLVIFTNHILLKKNFVLMRGELFCFVTFTC